MCRPCGFAITASLASLASLAATAAGTARAEPARAEEVVELRYRAPPGCPTREATIGLIRERAPAVRFAAGARRLFEVSVAAGERGFTGALVVDATADKQLAAERCDDLVTALALVIALAIDPAAVAAAPDATRPAPAAVAATASSASTSDAAARPARGPTVDGSLDGVLGAGVTPDPLLAGGLAGRATWRAVAAELAVVAGRDSTRAAGASASFTRVVARPAACLLATRRRLELGGCGHTELGLVRATGGEIINGRALTRLWAAVGAHGALRWPAAPARGFIQLQLGIAVPITRDRYRFMPGILVYETPPVCGWLGLGLGLRFP